MTRSDAARVMARGNLTDAEFSKLQSERIKNYWASNKSSGHRKAMRKSPIRTRAKAITK